MAVADPSASRRGDLLLASALAVALSAAWAWRDRVGLGALVLPDTDDLMRLQQVRDWLNGQAFGDLGQHRLGGGLPMHWSRLPDLLPAAIVLALTPWFGRHAAEIAMVVAVPTLLFAAALFLTARLARYLDAKLARTAVVIAAIAYPATALFMPGRIDHHGLQIVLLLVVTHACVGGSGAAAGVAAAAGIAIGLETAPLVGIAGTVLVFGWVMNATGADRRLLGFGLGASGALLVAAVILRPVAWRFPACDGFTQQAWACAQILAATPLLLVAAGRRWTAPVARGAAAIATALVAVALALIVAPECRDPYGAVDPALARLWLSRVGEAQPLLAAAPAVAIGYAGLALAGLAAALLEWRARHDRRWLVMGAMIGGSLLLACLQLRGAYAGALLAAPSLAALIVRARARGVMFVAAGWVASAGMLYPLAGRALFPQAGVASGGGNCATPRAGAELAALSPARTLAPIDLGPTIIAATRGTAIAGPYHRNQPGNRAAFAFFLGSEARAAAIARTWRIERVLACPGMFADTAAPQSMARRLSEGEAPPWLRREALLDGGLVAWRVEPGLSGVALSR